MKVYGTMSARRSASDLRACAARGSVAKAPHYNSVLRALENPALTRLLTTLVEESAAPLASVESTFAVDSTGFGSAVHRRWYDAKYGREMKEQTWCKAHAMVGVTTNVITSINVTDGYCGDAPELPALLAATNRRFAVARVVADKGYLSGDNLTAVEAVGAIPYVPFKSNSQGEGPAAWRRMWGFFMYRQAEFLASYHARSNVESTFSGIKRVFGPNVRAKTPVAMVNEVLCKALCWNLSQLVHAMFELGINPTFNAPTGATVTA
jgi:transposase